MYFPKTFLIPEDNQEYTEYHRNHPEEVFISKTSKGSQGVGIRLVRSPKDAFKGNSDMNDIVMQKYISNPLLIDNKKHDLRLYLLLVSVDPMIAYLNEEGLARFCTEDYEKPTKQNIDKNYIHLTNFSLNRKNDKFINTDELTEPNSAHKRTLTSYWKSVALEGYDVKQVGEN